MKSAVLSYNAVVPGQDNGWVTRNGNEVLLIQSLSGATWGAAQHGTLGEMQAEGVSLVDQLWAQLEQALSQLDFVVIYVGSFGAERAIEKAGECGLTAGQVVFVLCDCGQQVKHAMIERFGFSEAKKIDSECGGHATMRQVFDALLDTGELPEACL